jgi:hypothetical protein
MTDRFSSSLQWFGAALVASALVTLPQAAGADRRVTRSWRHLDAANGRLVAVEVRVDGHWVPLHRVPDQGDRHYFEAQRGENYALRIRNRTDRRVGVLISVDGLNAVNGERSTLAASEPMYVLDPRESATIRGWRTSLDDVRQFVFVDEERSYANRTGQANGDMGWIRVLAFEERRPIAWRRPPEPWLGRDGRDDSGRRGKADDRLEAEPPPASADTPADGSFKGEEPPRSLEQQARRGVESYPGTGWGDKRRDPVRETWFEPVAHAGDHIILRYEYERGLVALGILPDRDRLDDREDGRFAQPPRW